VDRSEIAGVPRHFERIKVGDPTLLQAEWILLGRAGVDREVFEKLIGKPVGDSFHLIPPFYADYGLNITIGRAVFIGYQCMFTGHGAIDIADEVMIANKVNLVTAGHPVEPDKRRAYITVEPITIERNVWIGTAATVLPGVTIGADSVVAAGAVVTHDVPPATLWRVCQRLSSGISSGVGPPPQIAGSAGRRDSEARQSTLARHEEIRLGLVSRYAFG